MSDHRDKADAVEAEIDGLEQESERLGEQIGETRADWESRKADDNVPGASGKPQAAQDGLPPEAAQHSAAVDAPEHRDASSGEHKQE